MVHLLERVRLHLPRQLLHFLARPTVLHCVPNIVSTCGQRRVLGLHRDLRLDNLHFERDHQPVQRDVRSSIWYPDLVRWKPLYLSLLKLRNLC